MGRRHIVVDDDTWEQLYEIKGPGKSFQRVIRELIDAVFPDEKETKNQTTLLLICPECGEDLESGRCPGCGYPEDEE